ncbi:hypothetical protein HZY62_04835 [Maribacter polysiphoniae]|uniref:Lipoprotein n=1 Tax=Maribacter polysiphoniae TaxID=429344 RepID=A0A316E6U4_9FLAO|nr:hypothetical protein [Maribacter polysiphoniae]MBD1259903.1 hypothetical protein [Maribacter polysiphoniae]PWK25358.1 hypothetical protein LX92_00097 [Maribacter polysiphoniae]
MNKKIIIVFSIFFVFPLFIGCKEKTKVRPEENIGGSAICFTKSEKEKIITTIFGTPDFQMFLHPNVEGRLPIQLVKNEFITPDLRIESNGYAIVFKDSLVLPEGTIHEIRIIDQDCEKKRVSYSIFYPIEGAVLTGTIIKSDTLWLVQDTNWGIKD